MPWAPFLIRGRDAGTLLLLPFDEGVPKVKAACAGILPPFVLLLLTGCVPTGEFREGPQRERLVEVARRYCAAESSADPNDTRALFIAPVRTLLEERAGGPPGSGAEAEGCEPGRAWYLGRSRMFVDVRRGARSERLDMSRGEFPLITDVFYLKPRRVAGRKVKSLAQALMLNARPGAGGASPPPPPPPDRECVPEYYRFAFLATDTEVYRQGATVKLAPSVDMQPSGTREIPVRCTSGWSVTGPATLGDDRTTLRIAPDAPVGAQVTVRYTSAGAPVVLRLEVIGRDAVVLTGRYSQRSVEGCQIPEPIGELEFSAGNRFSVTYQPFESYRDYWGSYSFDPATGRIALKPEGGNFVPPGLDLEGEAKLVDGRLVLTGLFLGSRAGEPQQGCTYRF